MLNMIDMCTAFTPDAVVFQTLFEVSPDINTAQKLKDALKSLKCGAIGEQISGDKKKFGVRYVRNKLFHEFLMPLDPKDFEILESSCRLMLESICKIVSCLNGKESSAYAVTALSTIDALIARNVCDVSLSDTERAALHLQQLQMLEQLDKMKEEKRQAQASLLNIQEQQRRLQQRLQFFNGVAESASGHWFETMRMRAGDAQPEI